jgi:flavin-binding protein dodecin
MPVAKVIELLAESDKGWEDAAQLGVKEASKTLRNIESVYVKEMMAKVQNNQIIKYRLNLKITFMVE